VQQTINQKRSKLFFGRRYFDYQFGGKTRLAADGEPSDGRGTDWNWYSVLTPS